MPSATIGLAKRGFSIFRKERAARRGAAIAFYAASIAPVLVIVVALAGLVLGQEAASGAIYQQFRDLLGRDGADLLQKAIAGASSKSGGSTAGIISVVKLTDPRQHTAFARVAREHTLKRRYL